MSRFANLEFDDKSKPAGPQRGKGSPPRDAAFFYQKAHEFYLSGNFESALRNFSRSLEQNAAFFDGWFGQVRMLIELEEYEEALLWTDKAMELFPDHPNLLATKAVGSCRVGALDKAMAYSDNAISRKGVTPYVWLARAEALLHGKSSMAERCIDNALSIAAQAAPIIRLEAGRLLLRAGRGAAAMEHLKRAVTDLPKAALAWHELGRCQAALGLSEADVTLAQCVSLRPDWKQAEQALKRFRNRGFFSRLKGAVRKLAGG